MAHPVEDQRANTRALAVLAASARRSLAGARGGGRSPRTGRPPFHRTRLPELTGWLDANAAYFTAYMLNSQHAANIKGPVLEIGVFAGKFLMLLHYLGRRHGNITAGIDIFTDFCDTGPAAPAMT
jgi:hypothetical protein